MSVYLSSPSCPSFIHLLHSLLSADLLPSDGNPAERQSTRLTCAMAVVRFINGMVDPLQTGESFFPDREDPAETGKDHMLGRYRILLHLSTSLNPLSLFGTAQPTKTSHPSPYSNRPSIRPSNTSITTPSFHLWPAHRMLFPGSREQRR
jgi:ribosomal biogenesis protein LAS1